MNNPSSDSGATGSGATTSGSASAKASDATITALVNAQAAVIGLPLSPAHHPGTVLNLERIAELAQLVMEFPLSQQTEPAPVFSHDKS